MTGEQKISPTNEKQDTKLTESEIGKMFLNSYVDITNLSDKIKEEIHIKEMALYGELESKKEKEMVEFRQLQVNRILKAYQMFKELTALINDTKMNIDFEKIKLDTIQQIIFKNNGLPTANGCIEFEDFFKNNMILRMLDLSEVSLANVDIRGIDFSGTNIHINPQLVFHKDLTNVNCWV